MISVLTTIANVFLSAAFGSAAFVQPGLGRAHLAGVAGMPAVNDDTAYGPPLFATALSASLLLIAAAIVLGVAISRTSPRLRWHGVAYAVLIPVFVLVGFTVQPVQPIAGFLLAIATGALAVQLPQAASRTPARTP